MEQRYLLSNGVRVLIEDIPYVHSAAIGLWLDTGSANEGEADNGISHFIEHMLFKGTPSRSALEIARSFEDTGGSINAFTDKENTCYYARVLAHHLPQAIDVLVDMFLHSLFDKEELKREKRVILEEIKMYEDTPDELVYDLFSQTFWEGHPLGRAIVGTRKSVRAIDREQIEAYLESYYTPDRLVVSVVGKVEPQVVLDQLEALLGGWQRTGNRLVETEPAINATTIAKYKDIEQVHLCLGTRGVSIVDEDRFPLAFLDSILGGGMSSTLFQEIREKRGLAYSISTYQSLYRPGGIFGVYAGTSLKNLPEVIKLVREEFERVKGGSITEEELERAREQLKGGILLSLEVPRHRMSRLARNELYYGRLVPIEEIIEAIDRVSLDDLTRVSRLIFRDEYLTATSVGPTRKLSLHG
ncbi:MAG: M16 family metallopeptidase [Bacteroidota bacterium]